MMKIFPWRRLTIQAHDSSKIPSLSFINFSPSLFHSQPEQEDIFDPPFSSALKTHKPQKSITEKHENAASFEDTEKTHNFNINSDLPFDFRYSYSETNPAVEPIGFREPPRFSPFGPGRLDRKWTGTSAPRLQPVDLEKMAEERRQILGETLSEEETVELVEKYRHNDCSRQMNLGRGGVTHNMLEDIHGHWKRAEAVRIKCLGVPTLDMDNVCSHLEYHCRKNQVEKLSIAILISYSYIGVEIMIPRVDLLFL
ncbi:hypothetical protein RDI58_019041 [Solanum bulbocastanum]|uniref:CRM domain-containing protein n=1 Tax=Solanum bulbocastanum TaxID=147425 RepID=A0AAN8TKR2_SOLBU